MNDALEVHKVDGGNELGHDPAGLALVEALPPLDPVEQLPAAQVLRDDVGVSVVLYHIYELDNVWMVKIFQNMVLILANIL